MDEKVNEKKDINFGHLEKLFRGRESTILGFDREKDILYDKVETIKKEEDFRNLLKERFGKKNSNQMFTLNRKMLVQLGNPKERLYSHENKEDKLEAIPNEFFDLTKGVSVTYKYKISSDLKTDLDEEYLMQEMLRIMQKTKTYT